ncbi:MAG TPA: polysaccharide deacetylase family protein [Chitinophagaceae bacterium]
MLLFSHNISSRLRYVAGFIGKEIGIGFQFSSDPGEYNSYDGPKINYSDNRISANECWIKPHALLFEKGIRPQKIDCFVSNEQKVFFKTEGDLPFDVFAATFYLLSRYEEYLPHQKDMYGRYGYENSLAFKEQFLNKPLINSWLHEFSRVLMKVFPSLTTHHSPFTFLPTYDIDEAYSYKHKTSWRTFGGIAKTFLKGQWPAIAERMKVLNGSLKDPYDAFEWMDDLHQRFQLQPRYFFLMAQQTGKYDKNILPAEVAMQSLVKEHREKYQVGIHPSWQSGDDPSLVRKEKELLEEAIGEKITSSRQHFLRFDLPKTFRHLIETGIKEDHSMGYGTINGFRASVASPFYWYDLEKEEATDLLLYPFCFMDANSFYEQKHTPQQALEELRYYHNEVKAVNGTLVTLWHNTFLGTAKMFEGWKEVYEQFIEEVSQGPTVPVRPV